MEHIYIIIRTIPCDDPYYPPSDIIYHIFQTEHDALHAMYNIYESIKDDFEKLFENEKKSSPDSKKNQFLKIYKYNDFENYEIRKYEFSSIDDSKKFKNYNVIYNMNYHIIHPTLEITLREDKSK